MNIGAAIKSVRKEVHYTQDKLALQSGLSQTSLSQIENGVKRPTAKTMKKICTALDIPEVVIYIMAMEETDVSKNKRGMYQLVHASIKKLALQMVSRHNNYKTADTIKPTFNPTFITNLAALYNSARAV